MTVRVARIFNTFGPRMHMNDGRVVSNFILQALQNLPMTVCTSAVIFTTFMKSVILVRLVTRENSYCFQCILAITFLSVCHMGRSGKNGAS